ncbi:MAG: hypothetical protein JWR33_245 [Naasia sp.]|nr:hypothetical protein [Naasia sp.]
MGNTHVSTHEKKYRLTRALGLGLGVALAAGAAIASPAQAEDLVLDPATHSVFGYVGIGTDYDDVSYDSEIYVGVQSSSDLVGDPVPSTTTSGDGQDFGEFELAGLADGDYTLELYAVDDSVSTDIATVDVTVQGDNAYVDEVVFLAPVPPLPSIDGASVTVAGVPLVGNTLTGSSTGWPAGTTLTYQWGYSAGQSGGAIDGATSSTLALTDDLNGYQLSFFVTGTLDGYSDTTVSTFMDKWVTQVKKPAADAPAANSGDLVTFLSSKGSTPTAADTVGLPSGGLNPEKDYTASVPWAEAADSYVDVYLYSTPTFLGTFPVIGGVVQIDLSASVLAALEGGSHTLVAVGQTSGGVQSVALTLTPMLASTGFDPVLPLGIAAVLLLLGAALLLLRRRTAQVGISR